MATLEVTNSAGSTLATITNPLTVRTTDRANALGDMVFTCYVGSPGAASLAPGAYVRWTDGGYQFWGIAETVARAEQEDGSAILSVTASDIARELALQTAGALEMAAGSAPVVLQTALNAILGYVSTDWTFTAGADVTSETIYLASDGASIWTLLLSIAEKLGAFLLRSATRGITITRTFTASGITARSVSGDKPANVAALLSLQNSLDGTDVLGRIYPFTAGNAAMRFGLEKATVAPPGGFALGTSLYTRADGSTVGWTHLSNTGAGGVYSGRRRVVQFPEINPLSNSGPDIRTAANALMAAAVQYLRDHQAPQRVLQLVMDDSPAIVGPMKTLIVTQGDIDGPYQVREATHVWAPNASVRSTLTLLDAGRMPLTGAGANVQTMEQARTYAAHAQLAPNVYQMSYNKPVDAQYGAEFRFFFDSGITQVLMAALDVKLGPLQSTVRAIGGSAVKTSAHSQGDHTHTTQIGPHKHAMIFTGHSHTGPVHTHGMTTIADVHSVPVTRASTGDSDFGDVRIAFPPATVQFTAKAGSGIGTVDSVPTTSTGGAGTETGNGGNGATGSGLIGTIVSEDNGTVSGVATGSAGAFTHDHTVDVTVTMEYGIYRDSSANAYAAADLEYKINSGAWLALTGATAMGDGWLRIPLTNAIVDSVTFTPLAASNTVTIRSLVASASEETFAVGGTPGGLINRWSDAGTFQQQLSETATSLALGPDGRLYLLYSPTSIIKVYQPGSGGVWALWDTINYSTGSTYNAICVDPRTGDKWLAGQSGRIEKMYGRSVNIAGLPNLTSVAAFNGYGYASGGTSIYRVNSANGNFPVISALTGASTGLSMAALNDGRIVQPSSNVAAFQIKVWEADLTGATFYTRSDAGNTWTPLSIASAANLVHVGCSDGRVRTYSLEGSTATLVWTSTGTPGVTGYPTATSLLGVSAVLSSKAAMIDAQLTVRSVVQAIVMT